MAAIKPDDSPQRPWDATISQPGATAEGIEVRRQETLLKTGALQTAILNSANFSSIATDEKGVIQIFNVGAERMLGYAAADVLNKITPADISDPQEVIARAKALSDELATPITPGFEALVFKASRGIEDIYELTYIRKDGSRFPAIVSVTALRDEPGVIIGYLLIGTDNTARKQVEEEQRKLDQRLRDQQFYTRSLVESNIDGLITTDPSGLITDTNNRVEVLTGCTREQLIGKPFEDFFTDAPRASAAIQQVLRESRLANFELTARDCSSGGETVVAYNATIFHDRLGTLQGVFGSLRDITESKRLDQVLQDKNAELESARFVAEQANKAKSDFLSSMSHELRSPLNAILGFAQLMDSDTPPATASQQASIGQILHAGWYLLELINEILDLAVIESGKLSLSEEPVLLSDVMLECQAMMEPQAQKRGLTLTFPKFDGPRYVLADRTRLKQVLINLLSNAIKYNIADGAVVVACVPGGAERVRISVRDTGEGLPPEKVRQLFQPFNRLGQERGEEEGTGIGLVMSKRLVELMHGVIGVESTVGAGSTFWFELAVAAPPKLVEEAPAVQAAAVRAVKRSAARRAVLYVEDNPANLRLVEQLMARRPDLELLSAGSGSLGVALAQEHLPAVILMDINLPGISGIEALRLLRADPSTAHIPVLAISANAMPADIKKGLEAGFFRYLTKPIKVNFFLEALDLALERSRSEAEAGPAAESAEFAGLRALLADDEEANRAVAEAFLTRLGFEVEVAVDGLEAVALATARPYDCVLMDVQMPGLSGVEATRKLRRDPRCADVPIIAMTGNALPGDREALLAGGMSGYLAKPIERGALLAALRRQLGPEQRAARAAPPKELAGVDVQEARARLDVSRPALERLLARFAQRLPAALALLAAAVAAKDGEATRQHAHSLSGSAGTLAMPKLRWAAAALESAARAGSGGLDALLATVEAEAQVVLGSLSVLPVPEVSGAGAPPPSGRLALLQRCLLAGDLTGITGELATLRDAGGPLLVRVRALVADYEYARAAALIAEAP